MSNTTQALSRIEAILDDSSFVEIGAAVTARAHFILVRQMVKPFQIFYGTTVSFHKNKEHPFPVDTVFSSSPDFLGLFQRIVMDKVQTHFISQ